MVNESGCVQCTLGNSKMSKIEVGGSTSTSTEGD